MQESRNSSDAPILEPIRERWSPRIFSDRPVAPEHLHLLFEAARWSASSMNEQPWSFLVAAQKEPAEFGRMVDCLVEGNAVWARHAPVLILSIAKTHLDYKNRENRHAWHDVGMATQNLAIQATALDLSLHPMGGFSASRAVELFDIPEGYEPVAMLAVGYLGDPSDAPEGVEEVDRAKRTRRPPEEFVFTGKWGETSYLI